MSDQQAASRQPHRPGSGFKAVKNKSLILIYWAACLETMWLVSHEALGGGGAECLCACTRLRLQMYACTEVVCSEHSTPCTIISFVIGFHSPHWQQVDAGRAGQWTVTQLQHELKNTREALQTGVEVHN